MQIALAGVLVLAVVWFVALRPKEAAVEPVAATPATQAPAADAGGASAQTALGKTVETAKNGAASADAAVKAREAQTGEESTTASSPAATPNAAAGATGSGAATGAVGRKKAEPAADAKPKTNAAQKRADAAIRSIQRDLAARRAVVVLVYSKRGSEDKVLHARIKNDIDRRRGRVRPYFVNVSEVGRYDGLLAGLSLSQTPSTIVIAPSQEAKVLGGLTSTERIDRLTSAALQTKPVATTP